MVGIGETLGDDAFCPRLSRCFRRRSSGLNTLLQEAELLFIGHVSPQPSFHNVRYSAAASGAGSICRSRSIR